MSKRFAAIGTVAVVLASSLPIAYFTDKSIRSGIGTAAETQAEAQIPEDSETQFETEGGTELKVESANSVGNYVTKMMHEQNAEKEAEDISYSEEYKISDVLFNPDTGEIAVISTQSASCTVEISFVTDDDSKKEILVTEASVSKGENVVTTLQMKPEILPEYYEIYADLYAPVNGVKLCATHIVEDYTQIMQEIYASTIEDFDPEYVVSLDEQTDTNFLVLNEEVIIADS